MNYQEDTIKKMAGGEGAETPESEEPKEEETKEEGNFEDCIEEEEQSAEEYEQKAQEYPEFAQQFQEMAQDERKHAQMLEEMSNYGNGEQMKPQAPQEQPTPIQ